MDPRSTFRQKWKTYSLDEPEFHETSWDFIATGYQVKLKKHGGSNFAQFIH